MRVYLEFFVFCFWPLTFEHVPYAKYELNKLALFFLLVTRKPDAIIFSVN